MCSYALYQHVHRHEIVPALGDDDVRVPLGGLDVHLVHGLDRGQILVHHGLKGAAPFLHVPQAAAEDADVSVSPEKVTLGADTTVTFSAECGYLSTGAVFEWSYTSGGLYMKAYGERVTVSLDARDIDGVTVELTVYAPDEVTVIARRTVVIETEYFVPTAENSAVTLSVRPSEDGTVSLTGSDTLVLGVNTLTYASPDTEVVWFVNGSEASREQTFAFSPSSDGVYTLTVTVNGIAIGGPVIVNAEGIRMPRNKIALIAGSVCGGAAGAGIIIAAGVLIVKKKKRAA